MPAKKILIFIGIILFALFVYKEPLHGQVAKMLCERKSGFHYTNVLPNFVHEKKFLCVNNTTQPPGTCSPGSSCNN